MTKRVYLDHAATTPVHPKVVEVMLPYFTERFGNPSSAYWLGQEAREAVNRSRAVVADVLGCSPDEVVFTSGATESINNGIKGVVFAGSCRDANHIITTSVEHHAVLETCKFLKRFGFEVTILPVDRDGLVDPDDVAKAITPRTVLVSVMLANNEVGTIQPVSEIGKVVREWSRKLGRKIVFHTDAVQAAEWLDLNVDALGVDMLSLSAHKFFGPKGVGVMYLRRGTPFLSQQCGGSQESGRRAGTENVAGIVGLAEAIRLAVEHRETNTNHCRKLRDRFISEVETRIPDVQVTGHRSQRLPNNASFCFKYIDGGAIILHLDFLGIAASSGSACSTGSNEPSHVLLSMGIPPEVARGSVRFSFGPGNTDDDVDYVLSVLPDVVARLRAISPFGRPVNK